MLGDTGFHPVLWHKREIIDLGVVPGDLCAKGNALNSRRLQVVGFSNQVCHGEHSHGFLWERGVLFDLNRLIINRYGLQVVEGVFISERGEIAGHAVTAAPTHLIERMADVRPPALVAEENNSKMSHFY